MKKTITKGAELAEERVSNEDELIEIIQSEEQKEKGTVIFAKLWDYAHNH